MDVTTSGPGTSPSPVRDWALVAAMTAAAHPAALGLGLVALGVLAIFRDVVFPATLSLPVLVVTAIAAATHRPRFPGHPIRPADEPELAALVRQVAERLGFRAPLLVRVTPQPDAGTVLARASGARTCVLLLGLPLLRRLTAAELAAVVAHEIAHQQRNRDRRTSLLLGARESLVESLDHRFRAPAAVAERLLRASQARSWSAELAGDADAAAVAGTAAVRRALAQLGPMSAAFHLLGEEWAAVLGEDGAYPDDLYEALDAALGDPHVARRMAAAAERDEVDPMAAASHPPPAIRLAALPEHPGFGWDDSRPVALRDADALRRRCVRDLVGSEADPDDLRPVRVLDAAPERFEGALREAGAQLAEVTGQDSVRRAVAVAADTVADGSWLRLARALDPEIGRLPPPVRTEAGRDVLVASLGRALSGVLLQAGWARASRWTAAVLVNPAGELIDVADLVEQAVNGNPAQLRALLSATGEPAVP
ncbi:M48 family metalloprotease [Micromonospora sp. NPDC007271]|uniref:M48 family metalloprotease n=1 Tax=Micromonospora sp. NPDC007271 TaxID=3154587 RepID=UPI0033E07353